MKLEFQSNFHEQKIESTKNLLEEAKVIIVQKQPSYWILPSLRRLTYFF